MRVPNRRLFDVNKSIYLPGAAADYDSHHTFRTTKRRHRFISLNSSQKRRVWCKKAHFGIPVKREKKRVGLVKMIASNYLQIL